MAEEDGPCRPSLGAESAAGSGAPDAVDASAGSSGDGRERQPSKNCSIQSPASSGEPGGVTAEGAGVTAPARGA